MATTLISGAFNPAHAYNTTIARRRGIILGAPGSAAHHAWRAYGSLTKLKSIPTTWWGSRGASLLHLWRTRPHTSTPSRASGKPALRSTTAHTTHHNSGWVIKAADVSRVRVVLLSTQKARQAHPSLSWLTPHRTHWRWAAPLACASPQSRPLSWRGSSSDRRPAHKDGEQGRVRDTASLAARAPAQVKEGSR